MQFIQNRNVNCIKVTGRVILSDPPCAKMAMTDLQRYTLETLQSPRFKNFVSSRNSLNPTLRPNLRPNFDDSLCHVIDSCKIFGSTVESCSHKNPECANFYHENPSNRILNRFYELNSVEIRTVSLILKNRPLKDSDVRTLPSPL